MHQVPGGRAKLLLMHQLPSSLSLLSSHMLLPISIDRLILTNDDKSRADNQDRWPNNKHHQQILINSQSLQLLYINCK